MDINKNNQTNKVNPESVSILSTLVKAVQELSAKVEALENG